MRRIARLSVSLTALAVVCGLAITASGQDGRWSEDRANQWYQQQPWPVGSNFLPSNAVNELEMWQAGTFDAAEIDREFGWAEKLGMNTMRVFLHNLLWEQDAPGFQKRIDQFLAIASRHHIRPVFVLFDSCWDPDPKLGLQRPPIPGVHNSGWVQAPGRAVLIDAGQYPKLKDYVQGVVGAFANDPRVLAWDVWNEPDNTNDSSYGKLEPTNKRDLILALLPQVFEWARAAHPTQPLTSGVWTGDWSSLDKMSPMARVQIEKSDVITFHNYDWPEGFETRVEQLQQFHRPIICTEYMARGAGSTFDTIVPLAKKYRVGAINWGLVKGRSQTNLPWDSWQHPYINETPPVWFHDVFHEDGTPYRVREAEIIREATRTAAGKQ
jgi:Cellulase (glycosyl hydrolase family 5)